MDVLEREAKVAKLPRWAQNYINKLEKDLEYEQRRYRDVLAKGNFLVGGYGTYRVPKDKTLHASADTFGGLTIKFRADDEVEIHSSYGPLFVQGQASNVVRAMQSSALG